MRCCATCRGRRSPRWHRSRFPANGAAPRGGRRLSIIGLAGWVGCAGGAASPPPGPGPAAGGWAFGRLRSSASQAKRPHPCKLGRRIHAAHAPAQPTHPAADSFRARPPRKRKRRSKAEADRFAALARSRAWLGSTERQCAENCRKRGGSDGGGVSRMDAATKPPWTGLRRPPPSDPPRQPAAILLLPLLLPLQVQGCKPCNTTTSPSLQSPAGPGSPATAAASATPGSSHHAGPAAVATPATAPPRCSRAHPRAARH